MNVLDIVKENLLTPQQICTVRLLNLRHDTITNFTYIKDPGKKFRCNRWLKYKYIIKDNSETIYGFEKNKLSEYGII